ADHLLAWADGGTTGISNLGQPCRKHHRLKHGSVWTPTSASKDKPPGWISPSGRTYPSEHQDWEPPHWPNQGSPPDPGCDPDLELPIDPFPEWHVFAAAHPIPAADTDARGWPEDRGEPVPEFPLLQGV
ncbi:HNH endonuclease signature motif containing protein, partial [Arthrobacter sp. Leaf69]|uniref:HNH endonuclease signature motif containing protein n=1 Tax=Arthrobacter sp. Leaf69 TaxID=1736232 RepID=UPI001F459E9F